MTTNGGDPEGLFRGAFMQSGSPIPTGDIENGQGDYDKLVAQTGCTGAKDTLQCLREAPFDALMKAVNDTPSSNSYRVHRSLCCDGLPQLTRGGIVAEPRLDAPG